FINIMGLAIGMACFFLIGLWALDELSFDRFNLNNDRIFRIVNRIQDGSYIPTPTYALAPVLKDTYPEVEDYARVWPWGASLIKYGEISFDNDSILLTDPAFFRIFTFPFLKGNPENALADINSTVLTEETAHRYFGDEDPTGKILHLEQYKTDLTVTGVIKSIPKNSSIQFDLAARVELLGEDRLARWDEWMGPCYLLLRPGTSVHDFSSKISDIYKRYEDPKANYSPVLQPLTRVHLYEDMRPGGIKKVRLFSLVAFFILIMACINFMNLSTARSSHRSREVGIRKVVGASRYRLIRQFLGEALITSFIAFFLALSIVEAALPKFNLLTNKSLSLLSQSNLAVLLCLFLTALLTGLLAGSYPAFFLSSFQAVRTIKNLPSPKNTEAAMRKGLIIFQFAISAGLITCTLIVSRQLNFIQNMDMGLNRDHVVILFNNPTLMKSYHDFKTELESGRGIYSVTSGAQGPTFVGQTIGVDWESNPNPENLPVDYTVVDYDFFKTFDMEIIQGRAFSPLFPSDEEEGCIINQTAVAQLGFEDPIGKTISLEHPAWPQSFRQARIIGVVKDFNSRSVHDSIRPFVFRIYKPWHQYIFIKVDGKHIPDALNQIRAAFTKRAPDYPFRYLFYDEAFNRQYTSDRQLGTLFIIFGILSILISCLGLLGLTSFSAEQRTREIGIRKVLGASVVSIIFLTTKEIMKWVALAHLIAWPIAWVVMRGWLNEFAYRAEIKPIIFLFSAALAFTIAVLTVIYQALKAALSDPITSLRFE
ncbi:MAG: ABC transporter permease, partial [Candidatus Aminicenantes bacterium]|nr:ABC transporter permease [Candidatus Aminicenantes bacterium]